MYRLYVIYISLCTTCTYNIMHVILWSILLFTIFICYIKLGSLVEDFFSCVICIRTTGSYVTHEINHFVYFYLDQKAVSLIKSGWQRRWQQNGWDSDLCQWNLPTQICYSNPLTKMVTDKMDEILIYVNEICQQKYQVVDALVPCISDITLLVSTGFRGSDLSLWTTI